MCVYDVSACVCVCVLFLRACLWVSAPACMLILTVGDVCVCVHAVFCDPPHLYSPPHQDPIPEAVKPSRGPKAGGTLITISGRFLDTGSQEDVQVTIAGVDCIV